MNSALFDSAGFHMRSETSSTSVYFIDFRIQFSIFESEMHLAICDVSFGSILLN